MTTDISREAIERLAKSVQYSQGITDSNTILALLDRAEAAEKRTQRDCGEEACAYLVKANLALSVARADAERLREALVAFMKMAWDTHHHRPEYDQGRAALTPTEPSK